MQTPSHVAISLFIWKKVPDWRATTAVIVGALLPDVTMFLFYGYQKIIGTSETEIWSRIYFLDSWQFFFDIFNSIPVYGILVLYALWKKKQWLYLVSASALVHVLCDLPLHNDDAHRHFLPVSNWRFISPVSYWDPKHYGIYALIAEMTISISACIYVGVNRYARSIRLAGFATLSLFLLGLFFAAIVWIGMFQDAS